jgi:hypothetical protein
MLQLMLPCVHNNVAINDASNVDNVGMVGGLDEAPLLEAVEGKEAGGHAATLPLMLPCVHNNDAINIAMCSQQCCN